MQSGHKVTVYSFKKEKRTIHLNSGIQVKILKKKRKIPAYVTLFKIIQQEKPDVILSNFSYVNPVVLAGYMLRVPKNVVWFHTVKGAMKFTKWKIFIKSRFLNLTTNIIANSERLKREIINDYKQPKEKTIHLSFTTSIKEIVSNRNLFNKQTGKIYIGCPGRICIDKNQSLLIDMLDCIQSPDYILVFAGSNRDNILENHPKYEEYKNQIIYLGILGKAEMVDFYKKMDLIVLPSLNEAFGLVYIESLAMGKPTFVSERFGALGYVKEEIGDYVFNPEDPKELWTKISNYQQNPKPESYFKRLYEANFSIDQIYKDFENILEH